MKIISLKSPFSCSSFPLKMIPDSTEQEYPKPELRNSRQQKGEAPTLNLKANEEYFGLSIEGVPGNRGMLKITAPSAKAKHPGQVLYIAFILAPCLWGFQSKNKTKDGVSQGVRSCDLECLKMFQTQRTEWLRFVTVSFMDWKSNRQTLIGLANVPPLKWGGGVWTWQRRLCVRCTTVGKECDS